MSTPLYHQFSSEDVDLETDEAFNLEQKPAKEVIEALKELLEKKHKQGNWNEIMSVIVGYNLGRIIQFLEVEDDEFDEAFKVLLRQKDM